jgi:hypothetical protein
MLLVNQLNCLNVNYKINCLKAFKVINTYIAAGELSKKHAKATTICFEVSFITLETWKRHIFGELNQICSKIINM